MKARTALRARLMLRWWVPFALLAAGIALSIAAGRYVGATDRARAEAEFSTEAREATQQIQSRIDSYLEVVRARGRCCVRATKFPHRNSACSSRRFAQRSVSRLAGIGYVARAPRRQLTALLRGLRLEGSVVRIRCRPPARVFPIVLSRLVRP